MVDYTVPQIIEPPASRSGDIYLVASGDLRLSANQECWPAQEEMEKQVVRAFAKYSATVKRAHPYDLLLEHGFIWSQRMGMDVFKSIPPEASLIVVEAV